jgi:hypothetical protein
MNTLQGCSVQNHTQFYGVHMIQVVEYTTISFMFVHFHISSNNHFPTLRVVEFWNNACFMQQNKESENPLTSDINRSGGPRYGTLDHQTD